MSMNMLSRGGVEDTRLEPKDSLSEDRPSRGQGQECSKPRTKDTATSVFQKKGLQKNFFRRFPIHRRTQNF